MLTAYIKSPPMTLRYAQYTEKILKERQIPPVPYLPHSEAPHQKHHHGGQCLHLPERDSLTTQQTNT